MYDNYCADQDMPVKSVLPIGEFLLLYPLFPLLRIEFCQSIADYQSHLVRHNNDLSLGLLHKFETNPCDFDQQIRTETWNLTGSIWIWDNFTLGIAVKNFR